MAVVPISSAFILVAGCAHQIMRGSVVMKIDDGTAHVCLGKGEVDIGDRLVVYDNRCGLQAGASRTTPYPFDCRMVRVGEARVVQTLNDHYSVIQLEPGLEANEGQIVEKE